MINNHPGNGSTFNAPDVNPAVYADWLTCSARRLAAARGDVDLSAALSDIRLLTSRMLGIPKTSLMAHPEMLLETGQLARLDAGLERLVTGEVLPYLLGEWEFYGHMFNVTPDVLIPRPETELLVESALAWSSSHGAAQIADTGTGSGCIAVSLALELPGSRITAVDISAAALQVARANVQRHGVQEQVDLLCGDLLGACKPSSFQIICANLPYIPSSRLPELAVSRREPRLALDGGPDGLDLLTRLIDDCVRLLEPGGLAVLEMDDTHPEAVLALAGKSFPGSAQVIKDYQGKPRLLRLEKYLGQF